MKTPPGGSGRFHRLGKIFGKVLTPSSRALHPLLEHPKANVYIDERYLYSSSSLHTVPPGTTVIPGIHVRYLHALIQASLESIPGKPK